MNDTAVAVQTTTLQDDWKAAVELWLASRAAEATRRSYAAALQDLLASSGRMPWEVTRTDVIRWVQVLKGRGLGASTICTRLAGVSSFFRFGMEDYQVTHADGSQGMLCQNNPAAGRNLRPKTELYGKAVWLGVDECKALLRVIEGREGIQARRDYALFLGYILLARRNSEWRVARWGDFERHGNQVFFRWSGKGRVDQRLEVPTPVWAAVMGYLDAAGRMAGMKVGEYLFNPFFGPAAHDQAISARQVGRLLKTYCRAAGLDAKAVHPHTLRHTGAMLRQEVGDRPEQIQAWLGHANLAITAVYLHKLAGKSDKSWGLVADLLGLAGADEPYTDPKKGAKKGKNTSDNR